MKRMQLRSGSLAILCMAALVLPASAVEVVQIRTGQSSGVPGLCGQPDDTFHMLTGPCGTPLVAAAFGPTEFGLAQAGPFAEVIEPLTPLWVAGLTCDPDARWISTHARFCGGPYGGTDDSILYARSFTIQTANDPHCRLEVCWAVDDVLGDAPFSTFNPAGVYVNGTPVAIAGGAYTPETQATQTVPLLTGNNWIYFYQRDAGCSVAGLILSATITCDLPVAAEPTKWTNVKSLYR